VSFVDGLVSTVTDGPFLLAAPVAFAAGLVSFLSPCHLPLVPGYLSYIAGLSGANSEPAAEPARRGGAATNGGPVGVMVVDVAAPARWRVVLASVLFVLGFSVPFVAAGAAFGNVGSLLLVHQSTVEIVAGTLTILLGAAFLGWIPLLQRDLRVRRLPRVGVAGAPLLGLTFGVSWTPCLGPTLAAVQTLAFTQGTAARGAALTFVYCLGLGLPFVAAAVAFDRAMRVFAVVKRHSQTITRVGGAMLIAVGAMLVSGLWGQVMIEIRGWLAGFTAPL
jgi:cytochrome c-type biogenesis protein